MEQTDWAAEQENIRLSKEIEAALVKLTQNNIVLMGRKMGGNITSCVKIHVMGVNQRRIHHRVSWNNACPKILNESLKKVNHAHT